MLANVFSRPSAQAMDRRSLYITALLQGRDDLGRTFVNRLKVRVDDHGWILRLLIGIGDAGEIGNLAAQCFGVETLDVAPRQLLERAAHVDLHEAVADHLTGLAARLDVR